MVLLDATGEAGSLYDLIDRGGVVALLLIMLVFILLGASRRWWVPGWYVRQIEEDREVLKRELKENSQEHLALSKTMVELMRRGKF